MEEKGGGGGGRREKGEGGRRREKGRGRGKEVRKVTLNFVIFDLSYRLSGTMYMTK